MLALLLLTGGQWFAFRVVAWTTMVVDFAQHDSLSTALAKTFDGRHPCALCLAIKKGQQREETESKNLPAEKPGQTFELLCDLDHLAAPLPPMNATWAVPFVPHWHSDFCQPPHLPPPRLPASPLHLGLSESARSWSYARLGLRPRRESAPGRLLATAMNIIDEPMIRANHANTLAADGTRIQRCKVRFGADVRFRARILRLSDPCAPDQNPFSADSPRVHEPRIVNSIPTQCRTSLPGQPPLCRGGARPAGLGERRTISDGGQLASAGLGVAGRI